ncbi:MAG: S41 family peptidase [Bacteroidetes bacterium]|nr:S41 family peptidase [Bacteroidota bacterium]
MSRIYRISSVIKSALLIAIVFCMMSGYGSAQTADPKQTYQKLAATLQIIDYFYVDTVNEPSLVEAGIIEMLKHLDPHSVYISKEEVERANEPLVGNFDGIGVQFQLFKDTILIISPVPGGPSDKLGIMAGDKIVKINGENATGSNITNDWVMKKLRGDKGTKVTVSIQRGTRKDLMDYTIVRDEIPLNSIDATYMVSSDIGYIRLNRFSKSSIDEFHKAMASLKTQGMQSLILDLRFNSGGYLNTAVELADQFLGNGKLIVYTEGLKSPRTDFKATADGDFEKGKLLIMINEGSASASEIVSGAIQDWDRGIILGRRSFGKGLVQKPFKLPDESVIRLTTAKYYTPTGRCIQKPYDEGLDAYNNDFEERMKKGEMVHPDSIHFPDSLKYYTPAQRVVYGGGGIMPDVFVPYDTTHYSNYYIDLRRKNVFNNFVLDYLNANRQTLHNEYRDFTTFDQKFTVDDKIIQEFMDYAEKAGVTKDEKGFNDSKNEIIFGIKALFARNLFDYNAYFKIINQIDDDFIKSVEIMKNNTMFDKLSINY